MFPILYEYIIQAFRLPFMIQHSPSLRRMISTTTDDNNGKRTIPEDSDEKHYYYGYSIPRQLIYIFSWQWLSERNQGLDF